MTTHLAVLEQKLAGLSETEREQWLKRFAHEFDAAQDVHALSDDERALVAEGVADLDAGRIVPDDDMVAFWNRNRRS